MNFLRRPLGHVGAGIATHAPCLPNAPCLSAAFRRGHEKVWLRVDDSLLRVGEQRRHLVLNLRVCISDSQTVDWPRAELTERRGIEIKLCRNPGEVGGAGELHNYFAGNKVIIP